MTKDCKFHDPRGRGSCAGCDHTSHIVKMYFFKEILFSTLRHRSDKLSTMYIAMTTQEGFTKMINFMTPGAAFLVLRCGHISHIVKMHYFLTILFSLGFRQTKFIVMMAMEGSTKTVNFMTPGEARVLALGRACAHCKNALFL